MMRRLRAAGLVLMAAGLVSGCADSGDGFGSPGGLVSLFHPLDVPSGRHVWSATCGGAGEFGERLSVDRCG